MNKQVDWTTIAGVKKQVRKKWDRGVFLREAVEPSAVFPLRIALRIPTPSHLRDYFNEVRQWIKEYVDSDSKNYFAIEWQEINNRELGKNQLPVAVIFETTQDLASWIGTRHQLLTYNNSAERLLSIFPKLKQWVIKNASEFLGLEPVMEKLIRVTQWIMEHPRPEIYIRQMCLEDIDTKFVEKHVNVLTEWLDLLLDPCFISKEFVNGKHFTHRFGFLSKPSIVRFRILDNELLINGLSDLTIRGDEFCNLNLDIDTVFVTENDVNGLSFPNVNKSILIFGRGYGFDQLTNAHWLKDKRIVYWGDIDTHGFAILNQFRNLFPDTQSFLMDREVLLAHKFRWVTESTPTLAELRNLSLEELSLYDDLRYNRLGTSVRLEQEIVDFAIVLNRLKSWGFR